MRVSISAARARAAVRGHASSPPRAPTRLRALHVPGVASMTRTCGQPCWPLATALATAFSAALVLGACVTPPNRETVAEICDNHVDDNGDGSVDCQDTMCMAKPVCVPEICDNGIDDNGDGRFDCADSECSALPICGGGNKCGNSMIDPGEDCDGADLGGRTCITYGFQTGTISCTACTINTNACSHDAPENCHNGADDDHDGHLDCADSDCLNAAICLCGNGIIEGDEVCDGHTMPTGMTCQILGFSGGTLGCNSDCSVVDTSACTPPVCGDGILNIDNGETCDDGNAVGGDGCDPTCQIELGPLCVTLRPLFVGLNHFDFTGGTNGFTGSCTGSSGEEKIFTYTPATSGTVTIVVDSPVGNGFLSLYARSTCADAITEVACANSSDNASPAVSFPVSAGVPVTVFVDKRLSPPHLAPVVDAGPYTLIVVQTP